MDLYYRIKWDYGNEDVLYSEKFSVLPAGKTNKYVQELGNGTPLDISAISMVLENPNAHYVDLIYAAGHLVLSDKFRKLLHQYEFNLEFYPVEFANADLSESYWYCHVLNNINGFDWEQSEYVADTMVGQGKYEDWTNHTYALEKVDESTTIQKTEKVIFKESLLKNRHLFQIKYLETYKFVSRELKEAIEAAGITGVKFIPLSEFTSGF